MTASADASTEPTPVEACQTHPTALDMAAGTAPLLDAPSTAATVTSADQVKGSIGVVAAAAASPGVSVTVPPPPAPSTIDVIDYKIAEAKDKTTFVTFLFELTYRYPASVLAQAEAAGVTLDPVVTLVTGKRFAELHAFHSLLDRHFVCLPAFPDRTLSLLSRDTSKEFIEARAQALQTYMRLILLREDIQRTGWFQKFLGVPSPGTRIREARAKAQAQRRAAEQQQRTSLLRAATSVQKESRAASHGLLAAAVASPTNPTASQQRYDSALGDNAGSEVSVSAGVAQAAPHPAETDEDESSEPATRTGSFAHDAHAQTEDAYNSDTEFDASLAGHETQTEKDRRRLEGLGIHNEWREIGNTSIGNAVPAAPSATSSASTHSSSSPPCNVILEFLTKSADFNMLKFLVIDDDTLLALAADQSTVAKVDSWLSGLFGKKDEPSSPLESSTILTSSSAIDVPNPLGAFYAFRRRSAHPAPETADADADASLDDQEAADLAALAGSPSPSPLAPIGPEFIESLRILSSVELTTLEWDPVRRWILVTDVRGVLTIYNPSSAFDCVVRISQTQIFSGYPVMHAKLYTAPGLPNGGLVLVSTRRPSDNRQMVTIFDLDAQAVMQKVNFCFNQGANAAAVAQAIDVCPRSQRLFVADSERAITIYDLTFVAKASTPPVLLHRLANGHQGAITSLAWNPVTQCLASGGDDRAIVLWKIAPRMHEKETRIYARLAGHSARVRSLAWSEDAAHEFVASGDEDGHVCLWSPVYRACVLAFRAHADAILQLQMTHRRTILTASVDKTAKLWSVHSM